jgi:hypothetical protein
MRIRRASAVALAAGALVVSVAPAEAQDSIQLDAESLEIIQEFQAELASLLQVSGDEIPDIIGEPGEDDLPPGFAIWLGEEAEQVSAELPDEGGSELIGPCMGVAASVAPSGDGFEVIDMAADFNDPAPPLDVFEPLDGNRFAQAFTSGNPFEVHVDGFVVYAGRADPAPTNHSWEIRTFGISIDSGGDPNNGENNRNAGTVNLKEDLPAAAKVNALFYIEGDMVADGGFSCIGSGYFETTGGNRTLEAAGIVLFLAMGLGALFNTRPARTWRG